ncbi:MAG: FAD-dependent monooxygenase [Granulosicoccus sp.]|nr:FAD-dependent monooxygenase [Granulosicoccus sp.]
MQTSRTQVVIIGGGPSGMLLSHILDKEGIESIVLERQSRDYVLQRIRAGVLESGTINMLRQYGLGERLDREGAVHDGLGIAWAGREHFFVDAKKLTGKQLMAFGQTAITEELYKARDAAGGCVLDSVSDVVLHDIDGGSPYVTYTREEQHYRIDADYIAGCDGYHPATTPR